jgi:hypothetical protein
MGVRYQVTVITTGIFEIRDNWGGVMTRMNKNINLNLNISQTKLRSRREIHADKQLFSARYNSLII